MAADFWNLRHQARIRVYLERAVVKVARFSTSAEKGGVTEEVIFGTVNRVSQVCSNNPKMPLARVAQLALRLPKGLSSRPLTPEP